MIVLVALKVLHVNRVIVERSPDDRGPYVGKSPWHRAECGWRMGPAVSERLMRLSPDRMMKRGHDVELAASYRKWRAAMEHYAGIAGMAFDRPSSRRGTCRTGF